MPLVQLHWESPSREQSQFVAQADANRAGVMWLQGVCDQRRSECPPGWRGVVLTEADPRFVFAAKEPD